MHATFIDFSGST